jgi:hypothetical protein
MNKAGYRFERKRDITMKERREVEMPRLILPGYRTCSGGGDNRPCSYEQARLFDSVNMNDGWI